MSKTNIPYARRLVQSVIDLHSLPQPAEAALQEALVHMTRHPRKKGGARNPPVDAGMRARIVAELTRDDTRQDVEIAMAAGFKTAAGAARVSEVRNGVR